MNQQAKTELTIKNLVKVQVYWANSVFRGCVKGIDCQPLRWIFLLLMHRHSSISMKHRQYWIMIHCIWWNLSSKQIGYETSRLICGLSGDCNAEIHVSGYTFHYHIGYWCLSSLISSQTDLCTFRWLLCGTTCTGGYYHVLSIIMLNIGMVIAMQWYMWADILAIIMLNIGMVIGMQWYKLTDILVIIIGNIHIMPRVKLQLFYYKTKCVITVEKGTYTVSDIRPKKIIWLPYGPTEKKVAFFYLMRYKYPYKMYVFFQCNKNTKKLLFIPLLTALHLTFAFFLIECFVLFLLFFYCWLKTEKVGKGEKGG